MTFGFKHGTPRDADLTFDVRFLPNPHYEAELRDQTGLDQTVIDYVESSDGIDEFYERLTPLLDYLLPAYEQEGKSHLTIGIGCTGGRHRSVVIAERLAREYERRRRLPGRRGAPRRGQAAAQALSGPVDSASANAERTEREDCDMALKAGINGFGRIGRNVFRAAHAAGADIDWVGVNDITDTEDARAPAQVRLDPRPLPGRGRVHRRQPRGGRRRAEGVRRARPRRAAVGRRRRATW